MESEVREGFLCPICMSDLGSFHKLQNHFETSHSAEDKAVLDQIKGLFSRAKGKFLGRDDLNESSTSLGNQIQISASPVIWEPQESGVTHSHTENFKKIRDARIDRFVIESNKFLIRLDKLIFLEELDKSKRKEYERTLVPWVNDADVPYCPTCGDRFNLSRRRHHCRLCGAIMCTKCSLFISYDFADELVQTLRQTLSGSKRRANSVTVNSSPPSLPKSDDIQIRCCRECYKLLLQRKNKAAERTTHKLLVLLYEKLQNAMESATKNAPTYQEMADSLNQGEEDYDLSRANEMRFAMMKHYETVDVVSKKIAALDTNDEENPPSPTTLRLQLSIRQTAHAYLQENMLVLQSLPSLPKLEILQKRKRQEREKKLRERMALAEQERAEAKRVMELNRLQRERDESPDKSGRSPGQRGNNRKGDPVVLDRGWSSTGNFRSGNFQREDSNGERGKNPLLVQIDNVQQMVKQAEKARRTEEAQSLAAHLVELRREYDRQEQEARSSAHASNPFLDESQMDFRNPKLDRSAVHLSESRNPFLADEELNNNPFSDNENKKKNPFLDEEGEGNPFLKDNDLESNPFHPHPNNDQLSPNSNSPAEKNPVLQQICYVTKCLDEAAKQGRTEEVAIFKRNLAELQAMYVNTSQG